MVAARRGNEEEARGVMAWIDAEHPDWGTRYYWKARIAEALGEREEVWTYLQADWAENESTTMTPFEYRWRLGTVSSLRDYQPFLDLFWPESR